MCALPTTVTLANGVLMPRVGLGTWQLMEEAAVRGAVTSALASGYQLIDTASVYKNEQFIGAELAELPELKDDPLKTSNKKGIFVTSKAGPTEMGYEKVYDACLASLKRLRMDSLDLYLLHWPGCSNVDPSSTTLRSVRSESWKAMERLLKEGHVRAIGVSNYLPHHIKGLMEDGATIKPHLNQIEIHPLCPHIELRNYAKAEGIAIQAYTSLGRGSSDLMGNTTVLSLAEKHTMTPSQLLLRWAIQQDILVIPKSANPKHIQDNIDILSGQYALSEDSLEQLTNLASGEKHYCWDPNTIA